VSLDISSLLEDWPYRPDRISVRVIDGQDGRRKIQLRLDLGLFQMEFDGRPDGRSIHDCDSWLDYHQKRQREHDIAHPDSAPYLLEPEDCAELLREGGQYYHRYLCFWHLGQYELCARDTERNLRLFAFVRDHARTDNDKIQFDKWRPYVTMMHARAVATPLVQLEQWEAAVNVLEAGIRGIERFLADYDKQDQAAQLGELTFLQRWKEEILSTRAQPEGEPPKPSAASEGDKPDPAVELQQELRSAVAEERFEDAARIRDELRQLGDASPPDAHP
jgi:UvrB/uvrC motif